MGADGLAIPSARTVLVPAAGHGRLAGMRLAYREAGPKDGPALVCLHGIGSNSTGFRYQLSALADTLRVIAWDAPGYGESSDLPMHAPSAKDYADALQALLDLLHVDQCHIAGSSLGAIIAAAFAATRPSRVKSLVLLAPATGHRRLAAAERESLLASRLDDLAKFGREGLAARRASALFSKAASNEMLAVAMEVVAAINPSGYERAARMLSNADIFEDLERIDAPTLILVGSNDIVTPAQTCARPIHGAMRNARIIELQGPGHLIKIEAAAQVNSILRNTLAPDC